MHTKVTAMLTVLVGAAWGCSPAGEPVKETPWSAPVNRLSVRLRIDRAEAFGGEGIQITPEAQVAGESYLALPRQSVVPVGTLHVRTPGGRHVVLDHGRSAWRDPRGRARYDRWTVRAGQVSPMGPRGFMFMLLDRAHDWREPDGAPIETDWSLRQPGQYEFWYELVCEPGWPKKEGGAQPWTGRVISDRLILTVHPLTPDVMREPSEEDLAALDIVLTADPDHRGPYSQAIRHLEAAMDQARNDRLAQLIVDALRQAKREGQDVLALKYRNVDYLARRHAYRGGQVRFESAYLRPYVELQMENLTDWLEQGPPAPRRFERPMPRTASLVLAYVVRTGDPEFRRELIALAKKHARAPAVTPDRDSGVQGYYGSRAGYAWGVLAKLDVLIGLTAEEAIELLGERASRTDGHMAWGYGWSFREMGPRLTVQIVDGRVVKASVR